MTTNPLNRRRFLRGLGGAAVAAPFLASVAEREAKSAGLPATAPKRLIVMFTHYGCLTNRWFPAKSHGELTAADYTATPTLKHMAPFASKLLMPRGIRAMNEWSFQGTHGQTTDPHTQVCGSYFTCHPVTPDDGKFNARPTGRSLDHICAEQVNPNGSAPLFIQIGGVRGSATQTQDVISWSQPQEVFPGYGTPSAIFNNLTGLFGSGTMNPDTYKVVRGRSVIDMVRDDLASLKRVPMSMSDQKKLNDWTELLHYTGGTVSAQCNATTAMGLGLTDQAIRSAGNNLQTVTPIMMNLATLSAICDANRVIFLKFPGTYTFSFLQANGAAINKDSHGISHRIGTAFMGGACLDGVLEMIAVIDDWYAQQFAYLVGKLDSFAEGDVKLLDNTATVWFNELSDGNSHNLNNMPILQAGSCGGYFKTGQAINVEGGMATMTRGHSEEDCANGQSTNLDGVGTPANVATQPINKYFCNLMNAIGVKAGADGYPAKGGTAPVTKFGKYDDTRLFKGAGPNPATIANPGEYTELRGS
jgi:hypothetical protein